MISIAIHLLFVGVLGLTMMSHPPAEKKSIPLEPAPQQEFQIPKDDSEPIPAVKDPNI